MLGWTKDAEAEYEQIRIEAAAETYNSDVEKTV
jgi:hypothetical protein